MLNKFKNFSKSKLGAVVVFIVALPFVFFGMGSVFQNKDTNNIAKIDNYNISTKNFTSHISSLGISSEVIRNNLDQNIILPGYIKNIYPYFKKSKGFISTSLWEDPGFVLIEASYCRTPVLSSNAWPGPVSYTHLTLPTKA